MKRFLCVALLFIASSAYAKDFGETVTAFRALEEWRIGDAKTLIEGLDATRAESKYLAADLAFLEGDYTHAAELLRGVKDDADVAELVTELLPLVEETSAATAGFAKVESDHFVVYYAPGKDEVLVGLATETLEAAYREIGADLGYYPPEKVRVEILGRPRDLARVSTLTEKDIETTGTIALCKYNKLMIVTPRATLLGYPWLDTLAHEYTHYVVTRATDDKVTIWLHEGLAKFEETRWRDPPGGHLGRLPEHLLATALKKGRLISFDDMYPSMAKLPSQEAAATAFAEVYSIVEWLHGQVGYEGVRQVLATVKDGKTERRAFAEVLGTTWEKVESGWKQHLRASGLKQDPSLADRAGKTVRLKKSDKDDENVGVEEIAEAKARKYARLGGLLRARGRLAAAAAEYEKARAAAPDEEMIAAKLARTYLELGKADKAIEVAEPLAEKYEDDAGPHATLGAAYLAAGNMDKAERHLLAAVRISPFDPAVRCGLAELFTASDRKAEAEREQAACRTLKE